MNDASPHPNATYDYISLHPLLGDFLTFIFHYSAYFVQSLEKYLVNTVEHLILAVLGYLTLCLLLYIFMGMLGFTRDIRNARRVLFITAHPDDEVMFFGPTIMHYVQKPNCSVYLMCLSSGKNYGMDKIRTNELYESCKVLGIKEENIFVHNNTDLPDSMDVRWPLEIIARHVVQTVETFNITNIVTFDRDGVSGHKNHCSIYYAIANLILDEGLPKTCGVYVLETVNIIRKYWLILDIPISFIMSRFRVMGGFRQRSYLYQAMHKHKSQLMWYRRLYLWFSRYMLINTLTQVNMVDIELDYLEMTED